jgi:hypothetical protein
VKKETSSAPRSTGSRPSLRAPALHVVGRPVEPGAPPLEFRLPYPPMPAAGLRAAHAVERRAKKGYFAALDSLRTGAVDAGRRAQLVRLALEAHARDAHDVLAHLVCVMDAVARLAKPHPLLPRPNSPLRRLEVTLQPGPLGLPTRGRTATAACLEWPLEWLRTRGYIPARGVEISVAPERA